MRQVPRLRRGGAALDGHGALPRIEITTKASMRGGVLRLCAPTLLLLCTALATGVSGGIFRWGIAVAVAVLVAWRPGAPGAAAFVLLIGLWVVQGPDLVVPLGEESVGLSPRVRLAGLVLALHLMLRCAALAALAPWRSRVEVAVLARTLRSVLIAQIVLQPAILAIAWLRGTFSTAPSAEDAVRLVALTAVAGITLLALARAAPGRGRQ